MDNGPKKPRNSLHNSTEPARRRLPEVGFDRIALSSWRTRRPFCPSDQIGVYRRVSRHRIGGRNSRYYTRRDDYECADVNAPLLSIYWAHTNPFAPKFRVELRAPKGRLIRDGDIGSVLRLCALELPGLLNLAEVEIAVDFSLGSVFFSEVVKSLFPRRARKFQPRKVQWEWIATGSRRSPRRVHAYEKHEEGRHCVRVEVTIGRDFLRGSDVTTGCDLFTAPWSHILLGSLRFVKVRPLQRKRSQDPPDWWVDATIECYGLRAAMRQLGPTFARSLRRRFEEHELQAVVRETVSQFEARLRRWDQLIDPQDK